ncbi:MAG: hypothetical protein AB7O26_14210, partial [Planctomycetaceae bacterium]
MPRKSGGAKSGRGAPPKPVRAAKKPAPRKRCNGLDGKKWIQNSISVWSDIRKSADEARLGHPAMFPTM